jgi:hypothetical protein
VTKCAEAIRKRDALRSRFSSDPVDPPRHPLAQEEPTNTSGPSGTYGCACVTRDAAECASMRYGTHDDPDARCNCLCHQWDDE